MLYIHVTDNTDDAFERIYYIPTNVSRAQHPTSGRKRVFVKFVHSSAYDRKYGRGYVIIIYL